MLCRFSRTIVRKLSMYNEVSDYTPPFWCQKLKNPPKKRVKLAMTPTPVHRWKLRDLPEDVDLFIKRDDLTGSVLSGNKIRKLEFLLADAISKKCKSIITCGSLQSNHTRATAAAAAQLGLKTHLILRTDQDIYDIGHSGNLYLSLLANADVYLVSKRAKYETEIKQRQETLAEEILKTTGHPAYCICIGGSDKVGLYGYLTAWDEIMGQGLLDTVDDIVVPCGSGGTTSGLSIGNYLTGSKVKVHAIAVCDDAQYFLDHVNNALDEAGLTDVRADDIVDIIDGYKGAGYGMSTEQDHELYAQIAAETGIFCDPVYTGKAVQGLMNELNKHPARFKGKRILYIHTGGIFGLYDEKKMSMYRPRSRIFDWKDANKIPKLS